MLNYDRSLLYYLLCNHFIIVKNNTYLFFIYYEMYNCIMCSKQSHGHKYCEDCVSERSNIYSTIKQNTKRLEKLFKTKRYTPEGFEKFDLYVSNVNKQKAKLMIYLEKDLSRRFKKDL